MQDMSPVISQFQPKQRLPVANRSRMSSAFVLLHLSFKFSQHFFSWIHLRGVTLWRQLNSSSIFSQACRFRLTDAASVLLFSTTLRWRESSSSNTARSSSEKFFFFSMVASNRLHTHTVMKRLTSEAQKHCNTPHVTNAT